MKNGKKKTITTVVVMLAVTAVLILGYFYFSNKEKTKDATEEESTQIQKIINKDLESNYPATPREVVKLYSRIITCFYNFELTEDELDQLADQIRLLFDDELCEDNPKDEYLINLSSEIESYQNEGKEISEYKIEQGSSVNYYEKDGIDYASVLVQYTLQTEDSATESNEQFVLRQDESGNWRILGWKLVDDIDFDDH